MINLKDTVELMNSNNYKERFKAEYWQLKLRYEKLRKFIQTQELAVSYPTLADKKVDCYISLLCDQKFQMEQLLYILEQRAIVEDIDLGENT